MNGLAALLDLRSCGDPHLSGSSSSTPHEALLGEESTPRPKGVFSFCRFEPSYLRALSLSPALGFWSAGLGDLHDSMCANTAVLTHSERET